MTDLPNRRGRPPKPGAALLSPVMVRFPQAMLAEIDDVVATRLDQPDRSSVIRELIAEALNARRQRGAGQS